MNPRRWGIALVLAAASAVMHTALAQQLHHLRALEAHGATVSARVIDLQDGRTLAAVHAGRSLTPASVSKLYVAAAALRQWGADHRFRTAALRSGELRHGRLRGDLVLRGAGDPGLTNAQLWTLAQRVADAGVRRIDGAIVVDQSLFGHVPCATKDRCKALTVSRDAYNAPLSAAGFDYSAACLRVAPGGSPGSPARLAIEPFDLPMFGLRGQVRTLAAGKPTRIRVLRHSAQRREWFQVSGAIAADAGPRCHYRAVAHPARYTGEALRAFLEQAGVDVRHAAVRVADRPRHGVPLVQVRGTALGKQLRGMLTYSNDYMADTLALDLARTDDSPPLTLARAGAWLTRYARGVDARSPWPGARKSRPVLASGSGLTVGSRLSADDLVALLADVYRRYGDFPALLGALTVPGQTPVAMLKGGSKAWENRVAVKTGSLSQPVSVFALAGYLRLEGGGWGAFAVLINGTPHHPHVDMTRALDAARADLETVMGEGADGRGAASPRSASGG
ncbi:MAG TPA: D-alanyl-D-alanine carboxypeptidase/D-alanyl-D-alanine-endopeptidase [Gammaproteobacteria bacterium]|nr:D-alanyl-D-alanine carboxypeptidase/D-alanyl-D-alanine-endopeptidase [Gammaproteobacteria bacterium]